MPTVLGFDIGATKIAWGVFEGSKLVEQDICPTPQSLEKLVKKLQEIIERTTPRAVGIGLAGTISSDGSRVLHCSNLPFLDGHPLPELLQKNEKVPVTLDNDARCALIGETWKGGAKYYQDLVLITLGTGVGGAVMQKGVILPHPEDVHEEVGWVVVDPSDVFPASGQIGSVEAFLGGKNLEARLQINLHEEAQKVRKAEPDSIEVWKTISYYFLDCMRMLHHVYECEAIFVGGIGAKDLDYYLQDEPPCPVLPAKLGVEAGMYGAARLALDSLEK